MSAIQTENPWLTSEPPKDGSAFVALGRVSCHDEAFTSVTPFTAVLCWGSPRFNIPDGWHFDRDGMSVAQTPSDEVKIDYWLPPPP